MIDSGSEVTGNKLIKGQMQSSMGFELGSQGNIKVENLPGKKVGESYNSNTTAAMNYFAFETDVRLKIKELVEPIVRRQIVDGKILEEHRVGM